MFPRTHFRLAVALLLILSSSLCRAGGPRYVAGSSYFSSSAMGQPLTWSGGKLSYYVDQGDLSSTVAHTQAVAMVDAAASMWSSVATAAISATNAGTLAEDVTGSNLTVNALGVIAAPADLLPTASTRPVAVIFDYDGTVINKLIGSGYSRVGFCSQYGVVSWLDGFSTAGNFTHGVMVINGLCTTNDNLLSMLNFQIERGFGRLLGLDNAQVTPDAVSSNIANGTLGWPVMQPKVGLCDATGGTCIPNPTTLRYDDIAALNRLYPVTTSNASGFTGKSYTASNTVSITGTVSFSNGTGMQGVNVVVRPLDASGNPLYQYTVTAVSGIYFSGNRGNSITGTSDDLGNSFTMWGSTSSSLRSYFDLRYIPLPPGSTSATYQVSFEAVNAGYSDDSSVGPYTLGTPSPSGSLATVTTSSLSAGGAQSLTITATSSAASTYDEAQGAASYPASLPASGAWTGRISQIGQYDWFTFNVRSGRSFSVVTFALDENGKASKMKAMPVIGLWDGFAATTASPVAGAEALNAGSIGETLLVASSNNDDIIRLGITDQRGDGRPDYAYRGWVLYADTVEPARRPTTGGAIVIHGMGFRQTDTVLIGGVAASISSISPTEITALAPASSTTGNVDVEVADSSSIGAVTVISGGITYNSGTGDSLNLNTAPSGTVSLNVPLNFSVTALDADLNPASGVSVTFAVTSGTATLGCGSTTCTVTASGDGIALMTVTATSTSTAVVTASLGNGASLEAHFKGGSSPNLTALTPLQSVAAGASVTWTAQALVLSSGTPASGQTVTWQSASGITYSSASATSNTSGIAAKALNVGPLTEGQSSNSKACLNGSSTQCVSFNVLGARPAYASMYEVSGATQSISTTDTADSIILRVYDMNGNPMAGGVVTLYEAIYAYTAPCARHTVCTPGALLGTTTATAVSGLDGSVSFSPASISGVATRMIGLAATGNSATVAITIERHP